MKRYLLAISFIVSFGMTAHANHITGGEMYYTFLGKSGNNYTYSVTLKLYRDCNPPPGSAQLDPTASIAIFNKTTRFIRAGTEVTRSVDENCFVILYRTIYTSKLD